MANNAAASTPAAALPKLGLLEEDDEFEEFPVEDWTETNGTKLDLEEWEADWDDENIEDDFSIQLRAELEKVNAAALKTNTSSA